ncbi:degs1, partial [Symbiodinium sp. KB8]
MKVNDFEWSYTDEPHKTRRGEIMKKYGDEINALLGVDPTLKFKVLLSLGIQLALCYLVRDMSWWAWFFVTYTISGTINHSLTLAMHEVSHNIAFKNLLANKLFGVLTNMPLGIPSFASFRRYHMEHHTYQGEDRVDTDVPTAFEVAFFNNTAKKLLWVVLQPAFYALRPLLTNPKAPTRWEAINFSCQIAFDFAIYHFFGGKALAYLIFGTLLGMGLHPMAGHFIAEHYTFIKGQETYSYYGPLNWFSYNVGYHNEHHDFPTIPGSRLPLVRDIAP